MKYPELFQEFSLIHKLPLEEWTEFEKILIERTLNKGEHLARPGELVSGFGIILQGFFRLYYVDNEGKEHVKAFRRQGELVGAYAELLLETPSRTHIQALTPARYLWVEMKRFAPFFERYLGWHVLARWAAERHFLAKEQREFEFMHWDAWQRYQQFITDFGDLGAPIPQHMIASYLGITPVALSRLLSKNRKQKN